jgi:glucose-6-phosphate isomerase
MNKWIVVSGIGGSRTGEKMYRMAREVASQNAKTYANVDSAGTWCAQSEGQ